MDIKFSFVLSVNVLLKETFEQQLHSRSSLSFHRRSLFRAAFDPNPYVLTKTYNHAAIPSSYQSGIEASRQHKTRMIKT